MKTSKFQKKHIIWFPKYYNKSKLFSLWSFLRNQTQSVIKLKNVSTERYIVVMFGHYK